MNESGPGFQNKVQQVTVGNTISFDTGLSNAVTIEKCTFLKSAFLFLVFDSPIEYQNIPIRTYTSTAVAMPRRDGSRKTEKTALGRFFLCSLLFRTELTSLYYCS